MKVIAVTTSDSETSATLDLFSDYPKITNKVKDEIRKEVGEYLVEQTLVNVGEGRSPIQGEGSFPALTSTEYKKFKRDETGNTKANLELKGTMLGDLDWFKDEDGIKIGVFGDTAPQADGHCNLSGKSQLPRRRFIPGEGQKYTSKIDKEVEKIIADIVGSSSSVKMSAFRDVETKSDLYGVLKEIFGRDLSNSELRLAVYRNSQFVDILEDNDLLGLL